MKTRVMLKIDVSCLCTMSVMPPTGFYNLHCSYSVTMNVSAILLLRYLSPVAAFKIMHLTYFFYLKNVSLKILEYIGKVGKCFPLNY